MNRFTARGVLPLMAVGLAGAAWLWWGGRDPSLPRTDLELPVTALSGPSESSVAIARDGSFVVLVGRSTTAADDTTLLSVNATGGVPTPLFTTAGLQPQSPFVSPDGRWVGFISDGRLMKVAAAGGEPAVICACAADSRGGAAWLDDGSIAFRAGRRLRLLGPDGRSRRDLTRRPPMSGPAAHGVPAALPTADHLLFTTFTGDVHSSTVSLLDLKTGKERVLRQGARFGAWMEPDLLVYVDAEDRVRAMHVDPTNYEPIGADTVVDSGPVFTSGEAGSVAAAWNGTLAFAAGEHVDRGRSLWWVTRDGTERRAPLPPGGYTYPRIAPDGASVALDIRTETFNVWLWRLGDNALTPLTEGRRNGYPAWFPDSRRLLFSSDRDGVDAVFALDVGRPEQVRKVAADRRPLLPYAVSPDSAQAVLRRAWRGASALVVAGVDSASSVRLSTPEPYALNGSLSPDGRWLAYQAGDATRSEVFVQALTAAPPARQQVSAGGGYMPLWGPSGTELFFVDPAHELMRAAVTVAGDALQVAPPARFFPEAYTSTTWFHGPNGRTFDLAPDGTRFLAVRDNAEMADRSDRTVHIRSRLTATVPRLAVRQRLYLTISRLSHIAEQFLYR